MNIIVFIVQWRVKQRGIAIPIKKNKLHKEGKHQWYK